MKTHTFNLQRKYSTYSAKQRDVYVLSETKSIMKKVREIIKKCIDRYDEIKTV